MPITVMFPVHLRAALCFLLLLETDITATAHPLSLYLREGFNSPGLPPGWSMVQTTGTTATWSVVGTGTNPPIPPYEGTGQAKFNSYDASSGDQARLVSRKVSLTTSTDPFMTFVLYHDDEFLTSFDSIYVEGTTGDSIAGPWMTLGGYRRPGTTPGWKQETVSLLPYSGTSRLFVSFRGVSQYGNNMYVDDVLIADTSFHDIGAIALASPAGFAGSPSLPSNASRQHGVRGNSKRETRPPLTQTIIPLASPLNIGAIVQNFGTFPEATYQVGWQIDGQNQITVNNSHALVRNGRDTIALSWTIPTPGTHVLTAWTSLDADSNRSNDSVRLTVVVLDTTVVFAEMFNSITFPPAGWTVVNRDGGALTPWFQGDATSVFVPYEGTGFAADNFQGANGTYIDDYLISPPIPGVGQEGRIDSLRFLVRSAFNPPPAMNFPDSLMILLSTSGADTSSFTTLLDYFSVPKTGWTLKSYQLTGRTPVNSTVRIAFRYLHYDGGSSGGNSDFVGVDFVHVVRDLQTGVNPQRSYPSVYSLGQNYPNPFNPSTEIDFRVAESSAAQLVIYNVLGERIATLFNGTAERGTTYRVRLDGSQLSSGVYFYRLSTKSTEGRTGFVSARKMLLIR